MRRVRRSLLIALAAAVGLALVAAAGGWLWLRGGLPQTEGRQTVAGLGAEVELLRDRDGLLTVRAADERDAAFGLGYAHAQDRLTQLVFTRRLGQGRLSELLGPATLRMDLLMRGLDLERLSQAALAHLEPRTLVLLEAYAAGINAYLAHHPGPLPPELIALGIHPAPWRPADSLLWGKLMALRLSGNWREELRNARFAARFSPAQMADLFPTADPDSPSTIPSDALAALEGNLLEALPSGLASDGASNIWALAGRRTTTGKPILANDPHLRLQVPSTWYLARLETPDGVMAGATAPGVPTVVIGHNGRIAWGFTTTESDTQDLVLERLADGDPERYETPDGPVAFARRTVEIAVRGEAEPRRVELRRGRFGPVVGEALLGDKATLVPDGYVLTLAWPALLEADTSADALVRLGRAGDWEAFTAAMRRFVAPQQNVFYADVAGNIGFYTPGLTPIREGHDGSRPIEGWGQRAIWSGFVPFEALPHALNPENGQLVNANNRVVGEDYPYPLASAWAEPYRAERIEERLAAQPVWSPADTEALQLDELSVSARELLPLLLKAAPAPGPAAAAHALLAAWDGTMARDRREPLLYHAWLKALNETLFADELGPLYEAFADWRPQTLLHVLSNAPGWCKGGAKDCDEALRDSLMRALEQLEAAGLGEATWGEAHQARFAHPILQRLPVIGDLLTPSYAAGGGDDTVNRATPSYDGPHPYEQVHAPSLRAVFDLADLDKSRFIIAPGQSGNLLSPHYADLAERWRDGDSVTLASPGPDADRLRLIPE